MPKKKSTSSKKLRRQPRQKKAPPSSSAAAATCFTAAEFAAAAEQAMNSQDPWQAIALYDAAYKVMTTTNTTTTSTTPAVELQDDNTNSETDAEFLDLALLLEKRAEVKVSVSDPDGARLDYEEALQALLLKQQQQQQQQQQQPDVVGADDDKTVFADLASSAADPAVFLERIASLHLYMGQLSQGNEALACYRAGIQALEASLQKRQSESAASSSVLNTANADDADDDRAAAAAAVLETRQQLAAACCSAAELYLTDLCFEDNAETECEAYIQQALHLSSYSPSADANNGETVIISTVDALQTAASLRLSQCRGMQAVDYILQCYDQMRAGCRALAALVGIRDETDICDSSNDVKALPAAASAAARDNTSATSASARELTDIQAVQNLPGFEFRCQTAKILLECAGFLKEQQQQDERGGGRSTSDNENENDVKMSIGGDGDENTTLQRVEEKMTLCVQAAIDVLASLLAENDEVIEIWFLMGDAYAALVVPPTTTTAQLDTDTDNKKVNDDGNDGDETPDDEDDDTTNAANVELAQHYWQKTLEMLESVKESLEQESMESSSQEAEDDLQQQLDEILCQMDNVRCKLSDIGSSIIRAARRRKSETKNATAEVMEE